MAKSKREQRKSKGRGWADEQTSSGGKQSVLKLPDGIGFYKLKKGKNNLDVVEHKVTTNNNANFKKGETAHSFVWLEHRNVGPDGKTVVCPKTKGDDEPCCICQFQYRMYKAGKRDVSDPLRAKKQIATVVRDRDGDNKGEVSVFQHAFNKGYGEALKEKLSADDDGSYDNWSDPEEGMTSKIIGKEDPIDDEGGKWTTVSTIEFVPRKKPLEKTLLKSAPSLDGCIEILSNKELEKLLKAGTSKDDDEDDDEEEDDADDDDDEDEKPAKRGKGKKKSKKEEDDDEDADEDEDEDDSDEDDDDDSDDDDEDESEDDDDGEDDDSDEDDDDEEPELKKGDKVSAGKGKKKREGIVVKIKGKKASVKFGKKVEELDIEDLTIMETDEDDDDDVDEDSDIDDDDDDFDDDDGDLEEDDDFEDDDDDDDEDEDDDDDEEASSKKKPAKKRGKK